MKEYIDRKELFDEIETAIYVYNRADILIPESIRKGLKPLLDKISNTPAAEVKEVIHAKWLGKPLGGYSTVRCSNCNITFKENSGRWKYCPECGAKIDL